MNTNPEDAALRMHCLELAIRQGHGEPVQAAQSFYDFATGQAAKSARERIIQILEQAGVR